MDGAEPQVTSSSSFPLQKESWKKRKDFLNNCVDKEKLNGRLGLVETANPGSKRMKEQEQEFLNCLNSEVAKINNCCIKAFLEIEDAINFYRRKFEQEIPFMITDIDHILKDLLQLEQFVTSAERAFLAIMKKHDSIIGGNSKAWFEARIQHEYFMNIPFFNQFLKLSKFYRGLRTKSNDSPRVTETNLSSSEGFKRIAAPKARQYFVKDEDLNTVQAWLLRHCVYYQTGTEETEHEAHPPPVQPPPRAGISTPGAQPDEHLSNVTSIYLDSSKFQLCNNFLHNVEGACLVRISWEGEETSLSKISFKTQSGITGAVPIKYQYVGPFLAGTWNFKEYIEYRIQKGKITQDQGNRLITIAASLLSIIKTEQLKPKIRVIITHHTFYDDQETIRIGLDMWVQMRAVSDTGFSIGWMGKTAGRRKDVVDLPVSVLKVSSESEPPFITDLVRRGLVHPVAGGNAYDHFLYGVTKLYSQQAKEVGIPSWMNGLESLNRKEDVVNLPSPMVTSPALIASPLSPTPIEIDSAKRAKGDGFELAQAIKQKFDEERIQVELDPDSDSGEQLVDRNKPSEPPVPPPPKETIIKKKFRVEPKTYFSNERSLFQWLNITVILAAMAMAIVGFGNDAAKIAGQILVFIAVLFSVYALILFYYRLRAMKYHKGAEAFEDNWGPAILMVIVVLAMLGCFFLSTTNVGHGIEIDRVDFKYPMIPDELFADPDLYQFAAPLPISLFTGNRTKGFADIISLLDSVKTVGQTTFSVFSIYEDEWTAQHFATPPSHPKSFINKYFKLFKHISDDQSEPAIHLQLLPTIPDFRTKTVPYVKNQTNGKDRWVLSLDCRKASLYHLSEVYSRKGLFTFGDIESQISGVLDVLNITREVPLKESEILNYVTWHAVARISNSIANLAIQLEYSENRIQPLNATLHIRFKATEVKASAIESARGLMSFVIEKTWEEWPTSQCPT